MDFDLTPEEETFRDEVREFLAEHSPPRKGRDMAVLDRWWKAVRGKRYVGFNWPKECGGGGGTVMEQLSDLFEDPSAFPGRRRAA